MKTNLRPLICAAVALVLIGLLTWQLQAKEQSSATVPTFTVIAIDVSNSGGEKDKLRYGQAAMALMRSLSRGRDRVLLLRFDYSTIEIGSEIPLDMDGYTFTLRDAILRPSLSRGTRPAVLFDHICKTLGRYDLKGYRLKLYVLTDGGNEDQSPEMEKLYAQSVQELSAIPQLETLVFRGARDGLREDVRRRFKALDGQGKLTILGPGEELR
jgi:hypothetical protein